MIETSIRRATLSNALGMVAAVVQSRTTLPILGSVLIDVSDGSLKITATDLDMSVKVAIPCDAKKAGEVTLPARRLSQIVKALTGEMDVRLSVNDKDRGVIECGASQYKLNGIPAKEFPLDAAVMKIEGNSVTLSQKQIRTLFRQTVFAVSTEESKYILNGVNLVVTKDGAVTVSGSDGRRLAMAQCGEATVVGKGFDCVIPTKAVDEFIRLATEDESPVVITVNEKQLAATFDGGLQRSMKTKLIEGTFPNVRQVIPTSCKERVPFSRESLISAIKRASLLTTNKSPSVKMRFSKNQLRITASTAEIGDAEETLEIKYDGGPIAIAFNPTYITSALHVVDDEEIYIELSDDLSPGVIRTAGGFVCVIMPLRME